MKLHSIETGNLKLDGGAMFGVVPKVMWSKLYPADENNLINLSMRCLLIEINDRKVLIDAGIGNKQPEKFLSHYDLNGDYSLSSSLSKLGISYDDITDVILTHLHFDHCGGAVSWNEDHTGYVTTFKNAVYHVSERQWDWAIQPNSREKASFLKENILPIKESGQLQFIKNEGSLLPGIEIKMFHGHTDGQVLPVIELGNTKLVYMADVLPTAMHIPLPYVMGYDTRPLITMEEKQAFLTEAAQKQHILFLEHDLYRECCRVIETEKGVRMSDTFSLNSIAL